MREKIQIMFADDNALGVSSAEPLFIMMSGLPYSGKSSYAASLRSSKVLVIHSSDALREELFGNAQDQTHNAEVFDVLHQRICRDLSSGKDVIYDATNLNYKQRMNTLQRLNKIPCIKICLFMATPFSDIVARRAVRERVVPQSVLERMYKSVWIPNTYEGWDYVYLVYPRGFRPFDAYTRVQELCNFPHDNPHHSLSVGNHCLFTQFSIRQTPAYTRELELAALLHDIGKPFTKSFTDSRGNPSEAAHYYGHQHVSAYDSLFYLPTNVDALRVSAIIQHHMRPYEIKRMPEDRRAGAHEKLKKLVGDKVYNDILALHAADMAAH